MSKTNELFQLLKLYVAGARAIGKISKPPRLSINRLVASGW
jgi:hypothetical protein